MKRTLCIWLVAVTAAQCCTIPVFRFALDRWEPDRFTLVIPPATASKPEIIDLLRPLRAGGKANLDIITAKDAAVNRAELHFPNSNDKSAWSGDLDAKTLAELLDSPARKTLREHILSGDSVTWVLVDAGGAADDAEAARITKRLTFLEQAAALPIQDPNDPDSQLGPGPPLKLRFNTMRLRLNDAVEKPLIAMLAGPRSTVDVTKPFAAAVFARGRVLGAWQMSELDDTSLEDTCMFLIGRCSCRVKQENPGWDILFNLDWEQALKATGEAPQVSVEAKQLSQPTVVVTTEAPPQAPLNSRRNVGLVIGGVLMGAVFWLLRKK